LLILFEALKILNNVLNNFIGLLIDLSVLSKDEMIELKRLAKKVGLSLVKKKI